MLKRSSARTCNMRMLWNLCASGPWYALCPLHVCICSHSMRHEWYCEPGLQVDLHEANEIPVCKIHLSRYLALVRSALNVPRVLVDTRTRQIQINHRGRVANRLRTCKQGYRQSCAGARRRVWFACSSILVWRHMQSYEQS